MSLRNATHNKHLAFTIAVMLVLLLVPLGGSASANHGDATLDVEPETATRLVGDAHTLTATIDQSNTATVNIDFENENGDNDTDGTTRTTPDLTCDVPANGTSCSVIYVGQTTGTDTWRAWIDHDKVQSIVEADTDEPQDENFDNPATTGTNCPGAGNDDPTPPLNEPDCTDVVEVEWEVGPATTLDCDDSGGPDTENETNPHNSGSQSNETYTCHARDQFGNPTNEAPSSQTGDSTVYGENESGINDPDNPDSASYNSPDYSCDPGSGSNDDGDCTVSVTQSEGETGTATICFWLENENVDQGDELCADEPTNEAQSPSGGGDSGNDLADQVEKTWDGQTQTGTAAVLDCSPETDSNQTGAGHTVTCSATQSGGQTPVAGANVDAEATGAGDPDSGDSQTTPDFTCTTGSNGQCGFTHTSSATGTTTYRAWIDNDGNQTSNADASEGQNEGQSAGATAEPDNTDVVTKTWTGGEPPPECSDGTDNDADGQTDYPDDPGCTSDDDDSESPDPGQTIRHDSTVSIRHRFNPHEFKGRVSSGPGRCKRGREVVVKEVRDGRDATEGRDRTNRRGRWSEPHNRFGRGRYYAVVLRKVYMDQDGDRHVCRSARSRRIRVSR